DGGGPGLRGEGGRILGEVALETREDRLLDREHEGRGLRVGESLPGSRLGDRGKNIAQSLPGRALDVAPIAAGQSRPESLERLPRLVLQRGLLHQIGPRGGCGHLRLPPVLEDFSLVLLDQLRDSTVYWHALPPV